MLKIYPKASRSQANQGFQWSANHLASCRLSAIVHFFQVGEGSAYELHNLPFAYKINTTFQDYTTWELFEFEYCGQVRDPSLQNSLRLKICVTKEQLLSYCISLLLRYTLEWDRSDCSLQIRRAAKPCEQLNPESLRNATKSSATFDWCAWVIQIRMKKATIINDCHSLLQGFETIELFMDAFHKKNLTFCGPVNWLKPDYNVTVSTISLCSASPKSCSAILAFLLTKIAA